MTIEIKVIAKTSEDRDILNLFALAVGMMTIENPDHTSCLHLNRVNYTNWLQFYDGYFSASTRLVSTIYRR